MIQSIGWSAPVDDARPPPPASNRCALLVLRPWSVGARSGVSLNTYRAQDGRWVHNGSALSTIWRGSRFAVVQLPQGGAR